MKKQLLRWIPVIIWGMVIYNFTASPNYTGSHTSDIISRITGFSHSEVGIINFVIRKISHFLEFGILALLTYWAIMPQNASIVFVWLFATFYAATDEWHQLYVPGRTAAVRDVLIDSTGALIAVLIIRYLSQKRKKPSND